MKPTTNKEVLNITNGKWIVDEREDGIYIECFVKYDPTDIETSAVGICKLYGKDESDKADAKAIVTAVNETYGRGINPEEVKNLVTALEELCKEIHLGKLNIRKDFSLINAHAYANKVLHNAKTIKP